MLIVLVAVLVSSCFSPVESGKIATKGVSDSEPVATEEPTATEVVVEDTLVPTNTPTAIPSPTNTPEPTATVTQEPTATPETYGHEVVWLDGKKMEKNLAVIKDSIKDELDYQGFSIQIKDPVVDIQDLPGEEVCYGWQSADTIQCLYTREGVNYYCDPSPYGWPECYPEDYVPAEENIIDKTFLVLYEGKDRVLVTQDVTEFTTSEMRVAKDKDLILAITDEPTVEYHSCAPDTIEIFGKSVKNSSIVFKVPLPQWMGLQHSIRSNVWILSVGDNITCE